MPVYNEMCEIISENELKQLQLERLQATVNRVYRNVPFYHRKFTSLDLAPEDVQDVSDLSKLPFTTKEDLRNAYPYEMFAVPLREVVRIHSPSGATASPIVVGYTKNDLVHWQEMVARIMGAAGVDADDVVQIAFPYGLYTGGFGMHYGAEALGASVIPASSGSTQRQVQIMQDFRSTVLVSTPSYAIYMTEIMKELEIAPASLSLKIGLFGGEPLSESVRNEIEDRLKIRATDNYGVSVVMGPGIAGECEAKNGLHIQEDHFLVEIIDPETMEVVPDGEEGELVITTLTREAVPLIRYRTRDITTIDRAKCACGRTQIRMMPVKSRTDEMIIVRGMNVYPTDIEKLLYDIEHIEPHYQIVVERENGLDQMTLFVEIESEVFSDALQDLVGLADSIKSKVHQQVGLTPRVKLVEPKTLNELKSTERVLDKRGL